MVRHLCHSTVLVCYIFSALVSCQEQSAQSVLGDMSRPQEFPSWDFNFSSAAPHYFSSTHGLLQQWSNTFFPNGHAIAIGEILPYTKLYHGRVDGKYPPSPEWLAFDIEMSYGIMGSMRDSHMLTYQTTRKVSVLYFDGESATLMGAGQLDTQMLQIWGNVTGPPRPANGFRGLWEEYARAIGLCDWIAEKSLGGLGWGFEGIVRMNAGFELIWCNFTSPSIRLVSHINITAPLLPLPGENATEASKECSQIEEDIGALQLRATTSYVCLPPTSTRSDKATEPTNPPTPPNWRRYLMREPFLRSQGWGWFTSATKHYGSSGTGSGLGEHRVKILSCGIMNYYSPKFISNSLARSKLEQEELNLTTAGIWKGPGGGNFGDIRTTALESLTRRRRSHRLDSVTVHEALIMRNDVERVLHDIILENGAQCCGMDWMAITEEIIQFYGADLMHFRELLGMDLLPNNYTMLRNWMIQVRGMTHDFLLPFLEYPTNGNEWTRHSKLEQDTFARCKFHHTRLVVPEEGVLLGPEEEDLKWAVEETMSSICRVTIDVGFSVESLWEDDFGDDSIKNNKRGWGNRTLAEVQWWREGIEELMAWLGWADQWTRCKEGCAWDEKCYIPMWPLIAFKRPVGGPGNGRSGGGRPGYGSGYGSRRPGGPGFGMWDESDLWEPKCVKSDYIMWQE